MPHPDVILLNGCTSAGKTGVALALQAQLPGLWLHLALDHFLAITPRKLHGVSEGVQLVPQTDGTVPVRIGPSGFAVIQSFHRAVSAIARGGVPVVVDDVIFEPRILDDWLRALIGLDVFFVALHCSLDELTRREIARGDRRPGQARAQFDVVHAHACYDCTVDSTRTRAEACAQQIVTALHDRPQPSAFERLQAQ